MKSMITTLLLGAGLAHFGITTGSTQDVEGAQNAAVAQANVATVEQMASPVGSLSAGNEVALLAQSLPRPGALPPGGMVVKQEIADDVANGVQHVDASVRQLPGLMMKVTENVGQHGIAALAYEDPELTRAGRQIGTELGAGIRSFAVAVAKDMVSAAHGSNIN